MPKMILFVLCLVIFAAFSVANAGNKCDISFVFKTFPDVNIVIALVLSFTLGVLVTLPIALFGRSKAAKEAELKAGSKMTRAEKKAAKQAAAQKSAEKPEFPGLSPESDELIKEKLGMESPRGKISLS